jgi:RNA polymerase sigma factor for flagellar operon FliA
VKIATAKTSQGAPSVTVPREQLILGLLPLVRAIANEIRPKLPANVELDDLISAGYLGLVEAAAEYDPSRGIQFETYAKYRIRGAMLDDLMATSGFIAAA